MQNKDHHKKRIEKSKQEISRWHSNRKKLTDYVSYYDRKHEENGIDPHEHEAMLNMALQGKSLEYWSQVIDAKVAKEERIILDAKTQIKTEKFRQIRSFSMIAVALLLFAGPFIFMKPEYTGYAVMDNDTIVHDVSELFYENAVYSISTDRNITSLRVSGKIIGNGTVRIYLGDRLVLDSTEVRSRKGGLSSITGLVIDDIGMDLTEPVNETSAEPDTEEENNTDAAVAEADEIVEELVPDELQIEPLNDTKAEPVSEEETILNQTDEMIHELNESNEPVLEFDGMNESTESTEIIDSNDSNESIENITAGNQNNSIELNVPVNETVVIDEKDNHEDSAANETNIELPLQIENLTQEPVESNETLLPENLTEEIPVNDTEINTTIEEFEIDLSAEIDFENYCIETCMLNNHPGELELRIVVEDARLYLSSATYSIVKEEIIEEIVEQNVSAEEFNIGLVEIGKPVLWEKTVNASEVDSVEVTVYAYDMTIEAESEEDISEESALLAQEFTAGKEYFELEKQAKELEKPVEKDKVKNNIAQLMEVNTNLAKADDKLKEKVDLDKETVKLELRNLKDNVKIKYATPGPEKTEKQINEYKKQVTVRSPIHYQDVLTITDIPESSEDTINVYWLKETGRELFVDVNYMDTNGNGLIDRLQWLIPHLSEQTFEIDIVVLNPVTYLRDGETWTVAFNTTGTGNLTISSPNAGWTEFLTDDAETYDEMEFLELKCGEDYLLSKLELIDFENNKYSYSELSNNDSMDIEKLFIQDYECNSTAYLSNYMHTAGYATLLFEFSNQNATVSDYAFDPETNVTTPNIIPSSPTTNNNLTCNFTAFNSTNNITNWYRNNESITVLYMPFEGNGNEANNATDYSGYGNNGTVFGATWNRTGGKIGGGYVFDGDDDYIDVSTVSNDVSSGSYSVELWFKPIGTYDSSK
ncbi:MAG: hypothetical protein KKF44_01210, partial [Nanoarchaeota archaeon]|nr:hypothetical protein [Nanoarchaeota archaeon]